jgi:hypothetical protein
MRTALSIALVFGLTGGASAHAFGPSADTFKASTLHSVCNPPSSGVDQADLMLATDICQMYLRGLTDGLFLDKSFADARNGGCLPTDSPVSIAEAKGEFEAYLAANPNLAENSAGLVAAFGIMVGHPCPAK